MVKVATTCQTGNGGKILGGCPGKRAWLGLDIAKTRGGEALICEPQGIVAYKNTEGPKSETVGSDIDQTKAVKLVKRAIADRLSFLEGESKGGAILVNSAQAPSACGKVVAGETYAEAIQNVFCSSKPNDPGCEVQKADAGEEVLDGKTDNRDS